MGIKHIIHTDIVAFKNAEGLKLNYSRVDIENCLQIIPHTIVFDYGIKDYFIEVVSHNRFEKIFFKTSNNSIPFDLPGAAFWLITRYEEYLPHKIDKFNRFHFKSCLAYQYNFLETPLVNKWLSELQKTFRLENAEINFNVRKYSFLSSIDVDNVYKYKHKGLVRTTAGFIKDLFLGNIKTFKQRAQVIIKKMPDPFDCYSFLIDTHKELDIKAIYFFLLGDYGLNDKNHSASNLYFQVLIKEIADYSMVGIHPSYGSRDNLQQLRIEVARLTNITHINIRKSRQHFSVLNFPETYKNLLLAAITEDYSMGYANHNGFRASYCYPYKWYSLDDEQISNLTIYPFCIAENTVIYHAAKNDATFFDLVLPIVNEVKKYNGFMISVFHNDTFNETNRKIYREFLQLCSKP